MIREVCVCMYGRSPVEHLASNNLCNLTITQMIYRPSGNGGCEEIYENYTENMQGSNWHDPSLHSNYFTNGLQMNFTHFRGDFF
jgi:hypothetical protein